MTELLTVAICTYNRAERLPPLVERLRSQECPIPFEILFVNNNSTDNTATVLDRLSAEPGPPVTHVLETQQGIPYARNRAIEECLERQSTYMLFMDDDELPQPGLLATAVTALRDGGAECAGGRVEIRFPPGGRPAWLGDELLGFLAETDHGQEPFWIESTEAPLWTANIAYRMAIFRRDPSLRFDPRYNRKGHGVGGGSDAILFRELVARGTRIRYEPGMVVEHYVDEWRLRRRYFLKLHFIAGRKYGQYRMPDYQRQLLGIPPFLVRQLAGHCVKTAGMYLRRQPGALRQAMNVTNSLGTIWGRLKR